MQTDERFTRLGSPMKSLNLFLSISAVMVAVSCGGQAEQAKPSIASRSGFLAVGERTFAVSDQDGRSWRRGVLPIDAHKVAVIGERAFALGTAERGKGALAITDDLSTWRVIDLGEIAGSKGKDNCVPNDIAVFDGRFMIVGAGCVLTSVDGLTWARSAGDQWQDRFVSFVRGSQRAIVSATLNSDRPGASVQVWSSDQNRFEKLPQVGDEQRNFREAIDVGGGRILVVGCGGSVCRWTDASSYAPVSDGPEIPGATWNRIARGEGRLVVAGELIDGNKIEYGLGVRDEATGTRIDVVTRSQVFFSDVAYDGARFAVTSRDGTVRVSPTKDGSTFDEVLGAGAELKSIAPLR
jgi:hypothetical protein